jgi:hypothetical protein
MENFNLNPSSKYLCYTCITVGYEYPQDISSVDEKFDYILFSDIALEVNLPWRNVVIKNDIFKGKDLNRFLKLCPKNNDIINQYEVAIYIDGNVQVIGQLSKFLDEKFDNSKSVSFFKHQYRNTVFDEIIACSWFGHSWFLPLVLQYLKFRINGFKDNFGLYECGVIVWNLKNITNSFTDNWWKEYMLYSKRDQIPLPYIMFLTKENIGILGLNNIRGNSSFFLLNKHKIQKVFSKKLIRFINLPLWIFFIQRIRKPNA